jgi:arylsulfatase A-like enzyme
MEAREVLSSKLQDQGAKLGQHGLPVEGADASEWGAPASRGLLSPSRRQLPFSDSCSHPKNRCDQRRGLFGAAPTMARRRRALPKDASDVSTPRLRTAGAWRLVLLGCLLLGSWSFAPCASAADRPNIVFIMADDMGYGDVGCYGAPDVRTPNIDKLAAQGVRFTQFYANGPECSPTRAAFLTGRYQHRVGGLECAIGIGSVGRYDDAIRLASKRDLGLPAKESTISQLLKNAGYRTALFGKWHLGYEPKFLPARHGFDEWFGIIGGNADYFHHVEEDGFHALFHDDKPAHRGGYVTDLISMDAVQYLRHWDSRPFFLCVMYTAPHTPIQGPGDIRPEPISRAEWNSGGRATYAAMIERMDMGIGAILQALEDRGLAEKTIVVFKSDNGGTKLSNNGPFSGTKGTTMEGGIRVPCIVRWPGRIQPGTVSEQMGITMDLTASFARVAGVQRPKKHSFDGLDILALVEAGQAPLDRILYWRGRRGDRTWKAVRDGALKYVVDIDGDKTTEHLFDILKDPSEKANLLESRPTEAAVLRALLAGWEKEVQPKR